MPTLSKIKLSGSTDGKGVKVTQTAIGSGDTVHTAPASGLDSITIFAYNGDTVARTLTLGWGGTTTLDNEIIATIPPKTGLTLVIADLPLANSLIVKAACDVANKVVLYGSAVRTTP